MVTYNSFRSSNAQKIQVAKFRLESNIINQQCGVIMFNIDGIELDNLKANMFNTDYFDEIDKYSVRIKDGFTYNLEDHQDCTVISIYATSD